jgi:fermentation-respiration switch protein FrsA (DUF1100 family)
MNRALLLLTVLVSSGCISLEDIWFSPTPLDAYTAWEDEDSNIPVDNVEWLTLDSAAVEADGETVPTTIHGVWLKQCLSAVDTSCLPSSFPWRQRQTVVYFHGNADHIDAYWDRLEILFRLGYTIFAVDYRGFGRSEGSPSEQGLYNDAQATVDHVIRRIAVERNPDVDLSDPPSANSLDIIYYGFSLGSLAAVDIATRESGASVLLEAANAGSQAFLDDGIAVGLDHSVFMDTSFDNLGKIEFLLAPKLLMHGTEDDFVRYEFAEQLFESARDPKVLYTVEGGLHGNLPCPDPQDDGGCSANDPYKDAVGDFLDEYVGGPE